MRKVDNPDRSARGFSWSARPASGRSPVHAPPFSAARRAMRLDRGGVDRQSHVARELVALGHEVKQVPPAYCPGRRPAPPICPNLSFRHIHIDRVIAFAKEHDEAMARAERARVLLRELNHVGISAGVPHQAARGRGRTRVRTDERPAERRPLPARPRGVPQRVAARRRRPQLAQTAPACPPREKSRKRRGEGQEDGLIRRTSRGRHTGFRACASPSSASPWI